MRRTGLVAPRHVGSSRTRARTRVPCVGRRILNHCATREAPTYGLKCASATGGEKGFISLVGNADSQNKLNESPVTEECCSRLGLIRIGKSKRLKRVRFGAIRSAFPALRLPGRGYRIRRPQRVCGSDQPIQHHSGELESLPPGHAESTAPPLALDASGREVCVEGCMATSLLCGLFGTRAVLLLSGTPSPAPIQSRREDSCFEQL